MASLYDPKAVANKFLQRSFAQKRAVDPMKLQKLVYFANGYYLAATAANTNQPSPLINEYFEAWPYGPVCPSLYHEFKEFGATTIRRLATEYSPEFRAHVMVAPPEGDNLFQRVCDYVWETYASKPSVQLSDITHRQNGAWDRTRREAKGMVGKDIPIEYILDEFRPLVGKA